MKKLILMRHGSHIGGTLTEYGEAQATSTAEQMIAAGIVPDEIVHSPVSRAVGTARKLQQAFQRVAGKNVPMRMTETLGVDAEPSKSQFLNVLDDSKQIVVAVSHEPTICTLSFNLTNRRQSVDPDCAEANVYETQEASWKNMNPERNTQRFYSKI